MGDFVKGVVVKVTSKDTRGDSKVYNCLVDTDDNGEEWFGCGFKDPNLNEGDEIEFDIDDSTGYTNIDFDTLVVTFEAPKRQSSNRGSSRGSSSGGRSSGRSSGKSSGRSSSSGRGSKRDGSSRNSSSRGSSRGKAKGGGKSQKADVDWDRKDNLIRLQSSQNTAVATIAMLVNCGAIAVPKKKSDAFDALQALIELEAARLFSKYTDIVDGCYDAAGGSDEEYDDDDDVPE